MRQRPIPDHHTGGVCGAVARQAFQLQGNIHKPLHFWIAFDLHHERHFAQIGFAVLVLAPPQGARQRPRIGRVAGHQLGQPVDLAIGHLQHAADILQHSAGLHLAEGDDLRDLFTAIAGLHIIDHLAAPGFAEINIEVGHRHAVRVEEAFEQQAVFQRIKIGDGQRPGHHRAGTRTTPRTDWNPLQFGPHDEIGHDQEIAGKTHAVDDIDFECQPLAIRLARRVIHAQHIQPLFQSRRSLCLQRLILAAGRQPRQDRLAAGRHHGAALANHHGVGNGFRQIGKKLVPVLRRFQPVLRVGTAAILGLQIA